MSLADRIKRYEAVTHFTATPRTPLMIRVDGRAFHTFTRGMQKPFDPDLTQAMINASLGLACEMQGFKAAYIQSDEATFCITDYDTLESRGWFDYDLSKIISISAATMTIGFNRYLNTDRKPVFDSRAFSLPASDVVNAFLWRAKDWQRNSLQMYARSFFSHKQLHGKKHQDIHNMLHEIGKNWTTDLPSLQKNGCFIVRDDPDVTIRSDILPTYQSINEAIGFLFGYPE